MPRFLVFRIKSFHPPLMSAARAGGFHAFLRLASTATRMIKPFRSCW